MKISIIYVYFNTPVEIVKSIRSIPEAAGRSKYEIIIVDNASPKKLPKVISKDKSITIIKSSINKGFGYGCNLGSKSAKGEYLLFLNPDTVLLKSSITKLLKTFNNINKVGIVGPAMIDGNNKNLPTINAFITIQRAIFAYSFLNKLFPKNPISKKFWMLGENREKTMTVDVISGACMLIKKELFKEIGGFDERFFMYFEEQDLCYRVKKAGFKAIFNPEAKIIHTLGASLSDKKVIKNYFQKSRYLYSMKYFGQTKAMIVELFLRFITPINILLSLAISMSLFLNLYKQDTLMLLIGDSARDFLAARDMLLTGKIPIVGIPSSVVWLHQGPTSVWLIGLSFLLTNFNPIAPAVFFGFIGALTTALVWYLGKNLFNERVGIISAFLYACAPLAVVNARMPYHTSLIPFFSALFFILFAKALQNRKFLPLLFFCLGLLLLVELSNIVVLGVVIIAFYLLKIRLKSKEILGSFIGFSIGILPFILYELQYGPAYLKFPLWIGNRIRLFFIRWDSPAEKSFPETALSSMYQEISASIIPDISVISIAIFILAIIIAFLKIKKGINKKAHTLLLLWIIFPLGAFFLHSSPGQAYFTLLFPAISILIGYFICTFTKYNLKIIAIVTAGVVFINSYSLVTNEFYIQTMNGQHLMPPTGYSFGNSWTVESNASKAIIKDAGSHRFSITAIGTYKLYNTSLDSYKFLLWRYGGKLVKDSSLKYGILKAGDSYDTNSIIIYDDSIDRVVKIEN